MLIRFTALVVSLLCIPFAVLVVDSVATENPVGTQVRPVPGCRKVTSIREGRKVSRVRTEPYGLALAGFIDVDHDNRSDREELRRLIEKNGGTIDAEIDLTGNARGKLMPTTRYLVVGRPPSKETATAKALRDYEAFIRRALELKVEVISLDRLFGPARPPVDPEASGFLPRRPPARGKGGAYRTRRSP